MKALQLDETRSLEYEITPGTSSTKIIAFGGGACNMAYFFHEENPNLDYYLINGFKDEVPDYATGYVNYTKKADPALVASAICEHWNELITPLLEGANCIIAVGCLGASGGSVMAGLTEKLCQECAGKNVRVRVFATLPYSFEGPARIKRAQECLYKITPCVSDFKIIKNDDAIKHKSLLQSREWINHQLLEFAGHEA